MKRYFVLVRTERFQHTMNFRSMKMAKWVASLNLWKYATIHDRYADSYMSKCIYIVKEGRVLVEEF